MHKLAIAVCAGVMLAMPASARDSLGVFGQWGAFRDDAAPRCFAIAMPRASRLSRDYEPFATIGSWPRKKLRGQVHFRLSRSLASRPAISLQVGRQRFALLGGGGDAWAQDRRMDAAIIAAMRSAQTMTVRATDAKGRRFADTYVLEGVATAMDAATLACSKR